RAGSAAEVKTEFVGRALDYLFGIESNPPLAEARRNAFANVAAFHGCKGTAAPGAIPHLEWVTTEGYVHVIVVLPQVPLADACEVLNSSYNYFEPSDPGAKK